MHTKRIVEKGIDLKDAKKALIMIHGRGADAENILSLSDHLNVADFALLAPSATNNTWYPYSFIAPAIQNEPWLSSALNILHDLENEILASGIKTENIFFLGFSQGACLTLEYVARNAKKYGGVIAFTGGLIGAELNTSNYNGDFLQTPILIASGDPDPHVPVARVHESAVVLEKLNASVDVQIFPGMGHTIIEQELKAARVILNAGDK